MQTTNDNRGDRNGNVAWRKLASESACGILLALAVCLGSAGNAAAAERSAEHAASRSAPASVNLDGLAASGPTGTAGMEADHDDRVVFEDGTLHSVECERWGFGRGAYRAWREDGALRFSAVNVSRDYGTIAWEGVMRDGVVEARYQWVNARLFWTLRRDYWFRGALGGNDDERLSAR